MDTVRSCLGEESIDTPTDYDRRYFYFTKIGFGNKVGHATCGLAQQALLALYRRWQLQDFNGDSWIRAVSSSRNPTVRGHLVEQICLATIARDGFGAVSADLGKPMKVEYFGVTPTWTTFIQSGESHRLYLPLTLNYPAIDAAILQLNRTNMTAHLFPIQVALAKRHKKSEANFYQNQWPAWTKPLVDNNFQIKSTFVWIDEHSPEKDEAPETVWSTHVLNAAYTTQHVGVAQMNRSLSAAIGDIVTSRVDF